MGFEGKPISGTILSG